MSRRAHPVVFLVLYLPFGVPQGYVIVTLAYLLSQAGLGVTQIAALVALMYVPQTWKVLWAPLVDTTLTLRLWYLIATTLSALLMLGAAFVPARHEYLWLLDVLVVLMSVACSISGMANESLMAHTTEESQKGRAGGWSQAGSLGGQGLGGGAGLWVAQHAAPWGAGAVLAAACLLCCAALLALPEPPRLRNAQRYGAQLLGVGREVWALARSRGGFLIALLVFLPLGTAAASNLWSPLARDWHAGANIVALVTGVLGGIISMVGSLLGGFITDLIDRKVSYALAGVAMALCAIAMALAPRTPMSFMLYTSLYMLIAGWAWAAFSGATLEAIGQGAAATKYNVLASLANIPLTYMTLVDGAARMRWGPAGMLFTEALIALLAVLIFAAVVLIARPRATAASYASHATPS
jgi:MFS transporter, PAT family, beta-lactamase induction signal transducer AmpG